MNIFLLESSNLWHSKLIHINYDSLHKLINLNHIPTSQINFKHKCKICIETKMTRLSFQKNERKTKHLDMIHINMCNLKFTPTREDNKYFITFVDDSIKQYYVYLLNYIVTPVGEYYKMIKSNRDGEYVTPIGE